MKKRERETERENRRKNKSFRLPIEAELIKLHLQSSTVNHLPPDGPDQAQKMQQKMQKKKVKPEKAAYYTKYPSKQKSHLYRRENISQAAPRLPTNIETNCPSQSRFYLTFSPNPNCTR